MNERIRALAEQAGGGLSCIAEPLEHPWKFSESELEKFAQLIVQECSRVAKLEVGTNRVCDAIEKHFGVEE